MTDARGIFDAHADHYDALRRRLVPRFDDFYGAAVGALSLASRPVERVLDVGAGTGILSEHVAAAQPGVELVLLDGAPAMLEHARARLGASVEMHVGDFREALPDGPFDAVVSSLAIHHVDDDAKRGAVRPGRGCAGRGGRVRQRRARGRPVAALHGVEPRMAGGRVRGARRDEHEWHGAVERMRVDLPATVEDQLAWLRDAGFADADCVWKDHGFAVLVGLGLGRSERERAAGVIGAGLAGEERDEVGDLPDRRSSRRAAARPS